MDYSFTARMEDSLDEVAEGERNWRELLDIFYAEFREELEVAESEAGMRRSEEHTSELQSPLII